MMSRTPLRVAYISVIFAVVFFLFVFLEPRRRSLDCRSLKTCFNSPPTYNQPLPVQATVTETTKTLLDGTVEFNRKIVNAQPSIIFMVLTKDSHSWSSDFYSTSRTAYDFLDVLISTGLNLTDVSLGMLTASEAEYSKLITATAELPFGRTTIYHRGDSGASFKYEDRHKPEVQLERRAAIAERRNYLMLRVLNDESHIIWMDADVLEFSPNLIQTMLGHAEHNPQSNGIITARCYQNKIPVYDKNAWRIDWSNPILTGPVPDEHRQDAFNRLTDTRKYLADVMPGTYDNELVPLDAVGGTILYMRAELVLRGVNFPAFNIVGTTWTSTGWVGLETEGVCYMAKSLPGGGSGCWVLGGNHYARHTDWG